MFKKQISAFHMNISSLAYHIDDLNTLLSLTNINFDFIGITETKIKRDQIPLSSIEITNYNKILNNVILNRPKEVLCCISIINTHIKNEMT